MAEGAASQAPKPKKLEAIVEAAKRAFDPAATDSTRRSGLEEYEELIQSTDTWALIPALNGLIKPDTIPQWMREPLMRTLTTLPLRSDGVRGTMEFVFSVHPSNNGQASDSNEPRKQGASITHEAVAVATRLLAAVPSSMSAQAWFDGISGQLFALMDGEAGADLGKIAAQVVGFGILGRKQLGAPGSAGWNAFVQPLLEAVNPTLEAVKVTDAKAAIESEVEVLDLTKENVLVKASRLEQAVQRLRTLLLSNPSPGLCRRVLKSILPQLWALASWHHPTQKTSERLCKAARDLMQTYLRLFGNSEVVLPIIRSMLCKGSLPGASLGWRYQLDGDDGIAAVAKRDEETDTELDWADVEHKSTAMANLLSQSCSAEDVSSIFLQLLRRWIQSAQQHNDSGKRVEILVQEHDDTSPVQELVEISVLQKLLDQSPDKLVSHFDQLLDLICQVLRVDEDSRIDDDIVGVVLSLLNLVITAPTFHKSDIKPDDLRTVENALRRLRSEDRADVSSTARNLEMLLLYRDEIDPSEESTSAPSSRQVEDRQTYNLAMTYITGGESPPPVVSEGLNMLSGLVVNESPILDIMTLTALMSSMLQDNEDYINLRVIKIFTELAKRHPKSTTQELIEHYLDGQEKSSTDVRLRFGEALLQVIERLGETFTGDVATQATEALLSIAGRRGYRPKTMARQLRDERSRKMKAERGGQQDEDEDEDESMGDDELTEKEKADNDVIAQIVKGWDSKRGSEDVRMRTSALSILGSILEINVAGVGPTLVSASVDLCVNVLALEPEMEKGILRRAAVLAILSFVKALAKARELRRPLGFGLTEQSRQDITRTLQYVADTDNDGLVQQHARDVVESLENWQVASIVPQQGGQAVESPQLTRLAGLRINPEANAEGASGSRPRIEEVE